MQKQVVEKAAEYLSLQQSSTEQIRSFEVCKQREKVLSCTQFMCMVSLGNKASV